MTSIQFELDGAVAPGRGQGLSATGLDLLTKAFANKRKGGAGDQLPGGSPVQSPSSHGASANWRISMARVLAFVEMWRPRGLLACIADEIYADPSSIVGSIGVVSASFGFEGAIARITRRAHTAGENKMRLDPSNPKRLRMSPG